MKIIGICCFLLAVITCLSFCQTALAEEPIRLILSDCERIIDIQGSNCIRITKNGLCGLMDLDGNEKVPCVWDTIRSYGEGLYFAKKDGKNVYIDENGDIAFSGEWEDGYTFHEGRAMIMGQNGKYGYIDREGNTVIECRYDYASEFSEGLALVGVDELYGYIDQEGKTIIPLEWDFTGYWGYGFVNGYAGAKKGEYYSFIDHTGELVAPLQWEEQLGVFCDGLASAKKDGLCGYIDETGKVVIPYQWNYSSNFSEGFAIVKDESGYGYIDEGGNYIFPCVLRSSLEANSFSEGLAAIRYNGKWCFLDTEGNIAFECDEPTLNGNGFANGYAILGYNSSNEWGLYNHDGEIIIPCEYEQIIVKYGTAFLLRDGRLYISVLE